jgi:hypothetical protein
MLPPWPSNSKDSVQLDARARAQLKVACVGAVLLLRLPAVTYNVDDKDGSHQLLWPLAHVCGSSNTISSSQAAEGQHKGVSPAKIVRVSEYKASKQSQHAHRQDRLDLYMHSECTEVSHSCAHSQ